MSRNVFGWSYPPGVTSKMIDDHFGGDDPCECAELRRARAEALVADGFDEELASEQVEQEEAEGELRCEACAERRRQEEAADAADDAAIDDRIERRYDDDY